MKTIYLILLLFMSSTCFADITFEYDYTHSTGFTKAMKAFEIGDYEKSKIPDFLRDEIGYVCTPESRPECMYLFV